jgi:hypothetical protein
MVHDKFDFLSAILKFQGLQVECVKRVAVKDLEDLRWKVYVKAFF